MFSQIDMVVRPRASAWALVGLAASGLTATLLSVRQIGNVDFWWQRAVGQLIFEHGIPRSEPFMFTRAGSPRIETAWGYCAGLAALGDAIGPAGLVILKTLLVLASFGLAVLMVTGLGRWSVVGPSVCLGLGMDPVAGARDVGGGTGGLAHHARIGWALLLVLPMSVVASSQRFEVRPEVVSYVFFMLVLMLIERARVRGPGRWLLLIPLIQVVWVNTHSLSVLGLALTGLWAVSETVALLACWAGRRPGSRLGSRRVAVAWLLAMGTAGAGLINPYGVGLARVPIEQFLAVSGSSGRALVLWMWAAVVLLVLTGLVLVTFRWWTGRGSGSQASIATALGVGVSPTARAAVALLGSALVLAIAIAVFRAGPSGHAAPGSQLISELRGPMELGGASDAIIAFRVLLVILAAALLAGVRRHSLLWLLVVGACFYLSWQSVRNVPLLALVAVPWASACLSAPRTMGRFGSRAAYATRVTLALAGVVFASFVAWDVSTDRSALRQGDDARFGIRLDERAYPVSTAAFLAGFEPEPMLNPHRHGSYYAAMGLPVMIDSRGAGGVLAELEPLIREPTPERVREVVDRYGLRVLTLDVADVPRLQAVLGVRGFRLVHVGPNAAVYFRDDHHPGVPSVDLADGAWLADVRSRLPRVERHAGVWSRRENPIHALRLARFCFVLGAYEASGPLFEDALALDPNRFTDHDALAHGYEAVGRFAEASALYERLARNRRSPYAYLAARASFRAGDDRRARALLEPISEGCTPREAHLYGTVLLRMSKPADAVPWLRRACAARPDEPTYHANLGTALVLSGETGPGIRALERAHGLDPSDSSAARDLALTYARLGDAAAAHRWADAALRTDPSDRAMRRLKDRLRR